MKALFTRFCLILSLSCLSLGLYAQVPEGLHYQAVIRDNGNLVATQPVTVEFTIWETTFPIYRETQSLTTNAYGHLSARVGEGTASLGSFSNIDWTIADHHLQVRVDVGSGYEDLGISELVSVPFAQHAGIAASAAFGLEGLSDVASTPPANGQVLSWNGSEWVPVTPSAGTVYTGGPGISIVGGVITNTAPDQPLSLTGTGSATVSGVYPTFTIDADPNDPDFDPTNELQTLTLSGQDLTLSAGGGTVTLPTGTTYSAGAGIDLTGNVITNTGDTDPVDDLTIGFAASGDLGGAFPGPTVEKIQGRDVAPILPASGEVLKWNGTAWTPATDLVSTGGGAVNTTARLTGDGSSSSPLDLASQSASPGEVLKWNGSYWAPGGDAVDDADADPVNELQTLSLSGGDLTLSDGGGTVTLPTGATYTAGTGIDLTGNVITNTAPDQPVGLTGGGATSVSGAYPNFTITSTDNVDDADADPVNEIQTLSLTANNLSLSNGGGTVQIDTNYWQPDAGNIYFASGAVGIGGQNPGNQGLWVQRNQTPSVSGGAIHGEYPISGSAAAIGELGAYLSGTTSFLNKDGPVGVFGEIPTGFPDRYNSAAILGVNKSTDTLSYGGVFHSEGSSVLNVGVDASGFSSNSDAQVFGVRGFAYGTGDMVAAIFGEQGDFTDPHHWAGYFNGQGLFRLGLMVGSYDTIAPEALVHFKFESSGNFPHLRLDYPSSNTGFGLLFKQPNQEWYVGQNIGNWSDGRFQIAPDGSSHWFTMLPNGNIGLTKTGFTTPLARLQVPENGDINASGSLDVSQSAIYLGINANAGLAFDHNQIESKGDDIRINEVSSEDIRLADGGGKVGIGVGEPNAWLHVAEGRTVLFGADTTGKSNFYPDPKMMFMPGKGGAFRVGQLNADGSLIGGTGYNYWDNNNVGWASVAIGNNTRASGAGSVAFGIRANAANFGAVALGHLSRTKGNSAVAAGYYTRADAFVSTAVGAGNVGGGNPNSWNALDPIFEVGNSTDTTNRSNALTVLKNGRVGINHANPQSMLDIEQPNQGPGNGVMLNLSGHGHWEMGVDNVSDLNFYFNNTLKAYILDSDGSYVNTSDRRLKRNIRTLEPVLDRVLKLRASSYQYRDAPADARRTKGFIAQEVEPLFPEMVVEKNGSKTLPYTEFSVLAIKAIQEQQVLIRKLEARIEKLERQLEQK